MEYKEFEAIKDKTNRNRKTIHVFKKDGKELLIGSTCANEFFGYDVSNILQSAQLISEFKDFVEEILEKDTNSYNKIWKKAIYAAFYYLNKDGRYLNTDSDVSTSDKIDNVICKPFSIKETELQKEEWGKISNFMTIENKNKVRKIELYWLNHNPINNFEYNIKSVYETFSTSSTALLACGVWNVLKDEIEVLSAKKEMS